jgi:hypothetical protein
MIMEIWIEVMMIYPKKESERKCKVEKEMMNKLRKSIYQRILNEREAARELLDQSGATKEAN